MLINSIVMASSWEQKADMPMPRYRHSSIQINDKIYILGGYNIGITKRVQEYDPQADTWADKTSMPAELGYLSICASDEKIYVIQGSANETCEVYEYNTLADEWTKKANLPTTRRDHGACVVDGQVYVIGGNTNAGALKTVEIYDPETDKWTKGKDLPTPRTRAVVESVNGKIYVMGGMDESSLLSASVEEFSPITGLWKEKTNIPRPRYNFATCVLDGRIYVIGGMVQGKNDWENVGTVEEYNPTEDRWALKSTMPKSRSKLSACSYDRKIYAFGGVGENWEQEPLATVETYNPWVVSVSPQNRLSTTRGNLKDR